MCADMSNVGVRRCGCAHMLDVGVRRYVCAHMLDVGGEVCVRTCWM